MRLYHARGQIRLLSPFADGPDRMSEVEIRVSFPRGRIILAVRPVRTEHRLTAWPYRSIQHAPTGIIASIVMLVFKRAPEVRIQISLRAVLLSVALQVCYFLTNSCIIC